MPIHSAKKPYRFRRNKSQDIGFILIAYKRVSEPFLVSLLIIALFSMPHDVLKATDFPLLLAIAFSTYSPPMIILALILGEKHP